MRWRVLLSMVLTISAATGPILLLYRTFGIATHIATDGPEAAHQAVGVIVAALLAAFLSLLAGQVMRSAQSTSTAVALQILEQIHAAEKPSKSGVSIDATSEGAAARKFACAKLPGSAVSWFWR
jgi:hypothetical protein